MEVVLAVATSVLAAVSVALIRKVAEMLAAFRKEHAQLVEQLAVVAEMSREHEQVMACLGEVQQMASEHKALVKCNLDQNNNEIRGVYEEALERGYITPLELDCANRLADSYFALGGNHYVHALIERMNKQMPVVGTPVPPA